MSDFLLRPASDADRPALRDLWQRVFGDGDAYIDSFFERLLPGGGCVVAEADGRPVSAMYVLRGLLLLPYRKKRLTAAYTYALATLPEYRGRGIGTAVYKAANAEALAGADAGCVLPAEAGLFPFYENATGAKPLGFIREARLPRAELADTERVMSMRLPGWQYGGIREQYLSGMPHAVFGEALYDHLEETGTEFFMLDGGVAAVETEGSVCRITELLVPDGDPAAHIATLAAWCPAEEYVVRTPLFYDGPGAARPLVLAALNAAPDFPMTGDLWWGFGLE